MRKSTSITSIESWVVYRIISLQKHSPGGVAICEQREWDAMQGGPSSCPHVLIKKDIKSEAEAERLARIQPGVTPEKTVRLQSRA